MPQLTELIQKLPAATVGVGVERAKSFGKSISSNIQPKKLISKGFNTLQSILSTESPALGSLLSNMVGIGSDIMSGAKDKSFTKPKETFTKPKITAPEIIKETTTPMLRIL